MNTRTFAIGDIHGDLTALEVLLARLPDLTPDDTLVFLGDSTCDLAANALWNYLAEPMSCAPPLPERIVHYDLDMIDGARLTFADATNWQGRILFLAAAEACTDAVGDGPVARTVLGVIDDSLSTVRWTLLRDGSGAPLCDKAEGLALDPTDPHRVYVVIDADNPERASDLRPVHCF